MQSSPSETLRGRGPRKKAESNRVDSEKFVMGMGAELRELRDEVRKETCNFWWLAGFSRA